MTAARVRRYFKIDGDVYIEGRWYLVDPRDQNGADISVALGRGMPAKVAAPVRLSHSDAAPRGKPLDYTRITGDRVSVVNARVAEILKRLAPQDVEMVPAIVDGFSDQYFIVNVLTIRQCIDEAASRQIEKYTEEDRETFPDLVGTYSLVMGLKIDKSKVQGAKMFWTWGWGALIVAEEIKSAFEAAHVKGAKFVEV